MHGRGRHEGTGVRTHAEDEEELDLYAYKVPPPRAPPLPFSPLI